MKKFAFAATLLAGALSLPAFSQQSSDQEVIDPSDLTRVYTQAAVFVTSDADLRTSAMFTGAWSEDIQFAGFVEANWGDRSDSASDKFGLDYKNGRAQYFQVHAMNNALMPRIGGSVDYIHHNIKGQKDAQLLSLGTIGLINPEYTGGKTMLFPNVAYASGSINGDSVDGVMLNLFATVPVGDSGAFIQAWPEYFSVSGKEVDLDSITYSLMFNAPLKESRSQWLMTKLEYNSSKFNGIKQDKSLKAEIGLKWFF
ncbi:MAG: hypothetical protein ACR2PT_10715 [Endozoicomonas sp.]